MGTASKFAAADSTVIRSRAKGARGWHARELCCMQVPHHLRRDTALQQYVGEAPLWRWQAHREARGARSGAEGGAEGEGANIRELALQVLHGGVVHGERVHEVLRIPPDAQLLAAPRLAMRWFQVACGTSPSNPGNASRKSTQENSGNGTSSVAAVWQAACWKMAFSCIHECIRSPEK